MVTQTRLGVKINGSSAEVGAVGYKNNARIYTLTRAWTKLDLITLNDLVARLLFSKRLAIRISFRFRSATCSDPSLTPTCLVPWQHKASVARSFPWRLSTILIIEDERAHAMCSLTESLAVVPGPLLN